MLRDNPVVRVTRLLLLLSAVAAFVAGCGSGSPTSATSAVNATSAASDPGAPCGGAAADSPSYRNVIWIWMENKNYDAVIGSDNAPYLNALAGDCGLATNYHNVAHPSLPNYIAATSGLRGPSELDRFAADCDPGPGCTTSAESIFGQAPSWKAYEESMPGPCLKHDAGAYAVRHNPPPTSHRSRTVPLTMSASTDFARTSRTTPCPPSRS